MIEARIAKLAMVASLAAFALLVAWNNVVDCGSNWTFVRHVLAMDTVFPGNRLVASRAITDPALWQAAYVLIIAAEALTGLLFAAAALAMATGLRRGGAAFARGKRLAWLGGAAGFLLWFLGFMVIGGEWFTMWQSAQWNGQQAAFRFYVTILLVLVFVAVAPD